MTLPKTKNLVSLLLVIFIIYACKKDSKNVNKDTVKPTISLNGESDMDVVFGSPVSDPGASAIDNKDGDISSKISSDWNSKVDFNKTDSYTVNYMVSDMAGNSASVSRKVNVKLGASSSFGEFNSVLFYSGTTSGAYSSTITAGSGPNELMYYPFFGPDVNLKLNIVGAFGTDLTFSQAGQGLQVIGTGKISDAGKTITLDYIMTQNGLSYNYKIVATRK